MLCPFGIAVERKSNGSWGDKINKWRVKPWAERHVWSCYHVINAPHTSRMLGYISLVYTLHELYSLSGELQGVFAHGVRALQLLFRTLNWAQCRLHQPHCAVFKCVPQWRWIMLFLLSTRRQVITVSTWPCVYNPARLSEGKHSPGCTRLIVVSK